MNQFVTGILMSIGILVFTFILSLNSTFNVIIYAIIFWFIILIVAIVLKKYSIAKGMALGLAIAIFILLILCGGLFFSY